MARGTCDWSRFCAAIATTCFCGRVRPVSDIGSHVSTVAYHATVAAVAFVDGSLMILLLCGSSLLAALAA